ncbi:hypothetical protein CRUP_022121 [Coryphaenoides rupestris]|nr:hypothetical protein CRUP_022121 [Coryphaenoides rupestris]
MATRAMFPAGVFLVGGAMMEDEGSSLSELPGSLPVPQLVMLANAATAVGGVESAAEEEGGSCDGLAEEGGGGEGDGGAEDAPAAADAATATKRKIRHVTVVESTKRKKPFHCKPCNYQAENEAGFVEHLGTHAISKLRVVNHVEGRSKAKHTEAGGGPVQESEAGGGGGGDMADSKGVIRCERCGYNTNRYDHYVAHLKHHSKEGEDHRVFKCTLCPYTTVSQYHWRKHLRNHFPSKLHTCDQCSYFSDRKSNYIQHIRTHTEDPSDQTHEDPFSCNYLAANQHEVTRHARQVHNGPKPLACPYCQYKTADRSNYKKHVELHLNPRQFHCPLCKYAASKKCNLQYHMKSRHVGCDIPIDVSKVKLRAKKGGEESEAELAGRSKSTKAKGVDDEEEEEEEEDNDYNSDEEVCMNRQVAAAAVVSRSAKKSGRSAQAAENEAETDRGVQRRVKSTGAADKGKGAPEGKEKAVRKVTTRQKKVTRVSESTKETSAVEAGSPAETPAAPVKRSSKKKNKKKRLLEEEEEEEEGEKLSNRGSSEVAEPEGRDERAEPTNGEQVALRRSMEEMKKLQKEKRMEKARKAKQEKDEQKAGVKTNRRLQSRRTGTRKSGPVSEKPTEDVPMGSDREEIPDTDKQEGKVKAVKRKAAEALDLSTKHYSPKTDAAGSPSPKRCKTSAADKPATKPSGSTVVSQAAEPWPALEKDPQVKENAPSPVKLKKTRKTNKKTPVLQDSPASTKEAQDSAARDTLTPPPDLQSAVAQATPPTPDTNPQENSTEPHHRHSLRR